MKTEQFVKNLTNELKPGDDGHFYLKAFLIWAGGTLALLAVSFWFFPMRIDLASRMHDVFFEGETWLCFALFLMATFVAYHTAIPGLLGQRERIWAWALIGVLTYVLLAQMSTSDLLNEFKGELDFYRGRCGPLIFILGVLETAFVFVLAKRAAPTNPSRTAAWIALAGGGLGLFVMQFVCGKENFLHLVIWHAVPVGLLVGLGALVGRRYLRW